MIHFFEDQRVGLLLSSLACFSNSMLTSALNGSQTLVQLSRSACKLLAFYATDYAILFLLNAWAVRNRKTHFDIFMLACLFAYLQRVHSRDHV
jgi:hypothetical protein